jgi:BirA family biotin operon repressor/biotin-[acetyl-CoA-carboxylase] ligase
MATAQDADARLLRALRGSGDRWMPAAALCTATGLNVGEVAAEMAGLRAAGYLIETDAAGNHRLAGAPERLIAADLLAGLPPAGIVIGREITVFEETNSTNDLAARAGDDGVREGLVIFAETQRAGRGRLGRAWQSPPWQGLWFSVLLRPAAPVERWPELTFCAALAVAEAAESETGRDAAIKWPNDVLIQGRKISGILLESHQRRPPGCVVLGIGLNVRQRREDFAPELREQAASLCLVAKAAEAVSRRTAAIAVLTRLESCYRGWPENFGAVEHACRARGCLEPGS